MFTEFTTVRARPIRAIMKALIPRPLDPRVEYPTPCIFVRWSQLEDRIVTPPSGQRRRPLSSRHCGGMSEASPPSGRQFGDFAVPQKCFRGNSQLPETCGSPCQGLTPSATVRRAREH